MENVKYQQMVYKNMDEKFKSWSELKYISEKEIYHFLHSLKGTAGSIGLEELSITASEKLEPLTEVSEKNGVKLNGQVIFLL